MKKTEERKKFSIILPTHNAESYISNALHSIFSQCYDRDRYEVIVVCDNCTDRTHEVAEKHGADIILDVNHGLTGLSRQDGIDASHGEWILFMDDDDSWCTEFALAQLDRYTQTDADIVVFSFVFGNLGIAFPFDNGGRIFPNVWSKMWRREFIGETKFSDAYANDDEIFCKAMFAKHPRIKFSDAVLYKYNYMRVGSITERMQNASEE